MKKCWILAALILLLAGCGAEKTMETVNDENLQPVLAPQWQMIVDIPVDASVSVLQDSQQGKIYLCDGYTATVQTLSAGDLENTVRTLTGFGQEELTLMKTRTDGFTRYEWVWAAAGEGEDQVGRACVLDDGNYHYALTVMAGESQAGQLQKTWQELFDSFYLATPEAELNTGS